MRTLNPLVFPASPAALVAVQGPGFHPHSAEGPGADGKTGVPRLGVQLPSSCCAPGCPPTPRKFTGSWPHPTEQAGAPGSAAPPPFSHLGPQQQPGSSIHPPTFMLGAAPCSELLSPQPSRRAATKHSWVSWLGPLYSPAQAGPTGCPAHRQPTTARDTPQLLPPTHTSGWCGPAPVAAPRNRLTLAQTLSQSGDGQQRTDKAEGQTDGRLVGQESGMGAGQKERQRKLELTDGQTAPRACKSLE